MFGPVLTNKKIMLSKAMTWFTDFPQNVPFPVIVNVMFCGEFVAAVLKLTSVSDIPKTSLWSFGTEA